MNSCRFEDYIGFLRDNISNLIEYREATGTLEPDLLKIRNDLFNQDPFVVIGASVQATKAFAAENLYH
jgi:hypothetical protein